MRRFAVAAVTVVVLLLAWWLWPHPPSPLSRPASGTSTPSTSTRLPEATARTSASGGVDDAAESYPIAAALNAPESNISRDLDTLSQLFDAWRSNFPRDGNPVGENAEITAALAGQNPLGLVLVPRGHRAINAQGELCDRWGTPFRFHQLSGQQMEIRSAGPDRKFATPDDAVWTPQ